MFRRPPVPADLAAADRRPDPAEVPRGYRLRRIGPAQWVAEPYSVRWRMWGIACAVALVTCGATIQAMRVYHLRKAQAAIVAVNGVPIRRDQVVAHLERKYGPAVVGSMVADDLMRQFAVSQGCWPSVEQVEARFRKEAAEPGFMERMMKDNVTEAEYKKRLRHRLAEINLIVKDVRPSEADVRYFYSRNVDPRNPRAVFRSPAKMQVAVIVTDTRGAAEAALLDLARHQPWLAVVARYSVDRSREHAGLMDPFAKGGSVFSASTDAEAAIWRLREGDRTGVIACAGKWWIVRCLRKWPESVIPYDRAHEDAEMGARIEIGAARNAARIAAERNEFVRRASIQVVEPAYDAVARPVVSAPPWQP